MTKTEFAWLSALVDECCESGEAYRLGYLEGVIDGLNARKRKGMLDIRVKGEHLLCGEELIYTSDKAKREKESRDEDNQAES